jgi:hypothetical protein
MSLKKDNNYKKKILKKDTIFNKKKTFKNTKYLKKKNNTIKKGGSKELDGLINTSSGLFSKLSGLFSNEPPDIEITSIPYITQDTYSFNGEIIKPYEYYNNKKNIEHYKSRMTDKQNRVSYEFQNELNKCYINSDNPKNSSKKSSFKYVLTLGQKKNLIENFCIDPKKFEDLKDIIYVHPENIKETNYCSSIKDKHLTDKEKDELNAKINQDDIEKVQVKF